MAAPFLETAMSNLSQESIELKGVDSLFALYEIAMGYSGQCQVVASFLAGLYNGSDYPFDLTELRVIDDAIFEHCMNVLRMDTRLCKQEVHQYFEHGSEKFQTMIGRWKLEQACRS